MASNRLTGSPMRLAVAPALEPQPEHAAQLKGDQRDRHQLPGMVQGFES